MNSEYCLSDAQTTYVNIPYDGTSGLNSSSVFLPNPLPTTRIIGSPPSTPNKSTRSLPCLPTGEIYFSLNQPSLDGYATITSCNATDKVQLRLSPSMEYLDKSDFPFNASEIRSDTSDDDIERPSESNTIIMIIRDAFIVPFR